MNLLADSFQDPERARVIYLTAGGLALIAILLAAGTVWWWRSSRVEHPALGPLEVMGLRSWSKGDPDQRRSVLESVRPAGAEVGDSSLVVPDPVDLLKKDRERPIDFDDLQGDDDEDYDWFDDHDDEADHDDFDDDDHDHTTGPVDPLLRSKPRDY